MRRAEKVAKLILHGEHTPRTVTVLLPRKKEPLVSDICYIDWRDLRALAAAYLDEVPDKVIKDRIASGIVNPDHARARFGLPPLRARKAKRKVKAKAKRRRRPKR